MARAGGRSADGTSRKIVWRSALPRLAGVALSLLIAGSCARNRLVARPDVTPRLTSEETRAAALEAARSDPEAGAALSHDEQLAHVISRTSFGPQPGDRARIDAEGIAGYLEEQLHPESIDDGALAQRLAGLTGLKETDAQRVQELDSFRKGQKEKREAKAREEAAQETDAGSPEMKEPQEMAAVAQTDELKARRRGKKDLGKIGRGPGFDFTLELEEAKLLRAVYSKRQLQEVMTDFWFNHFNIFAGKDRESALLPAYENDVIRAHALGSFRELLFATAHSPAMLIYLDNWREHLDRDGQAPGEMEMRRRRRVRGLRRELRPRAPRAPYAWRRRRLHPGRCDRGRAPASPDGPVSRTRRTQSAVCLPAARTRSRREEHRAGKNHRGGRRRGGWRSSPRADLADNPATARSSSRPSWCAGLSPMIRRTLLVAKVAQVYLDTALRGRRHPLDAVRAIFASPEFWKPARAPGLKMRSPLRAGRGLGARVGERTSTIRSGWRGRSRASASRSSPTRRRPATATRWRPGLRRERCSRASTSGSRWRRGQLERDRHRSFVRSPLVRRTTARCSRGPRPGSARPSSSENTRRRPCWSSSLTSLAAEAAGAGGAARGRAPSSARLELQRR